MNTWASLQSSVELGRGQSKGAVWRLPTRDFLVDYVLRMLRLRRLLRRLPSSSSSSSSASSSLLLHIINRVPLIPILFRLLLRLLLLLLLLLLPSSLDYSPYLSSSLSATAQPGFPSKILLKS